RAAGAVAVLGAGLPHFGAAQTNLWSGVVIARQHGVDVGTPAVAVGHPVTISSGPDAHRADALDHGGVQTQRALRYAQRALLVAVRASDRHVQRGQLAGAAAGTGAARTVTVGDTGQTGIAAANAGVTLSVGRTADVS